MKESTIFVCDHCLKQFPRGFIEAHEAKCLAEKVAQQKQAEENAKRWADRIAKAEDWARASKPVCLLVDNGFDEEAKLVCMEWAHWSLWDCGTSHGWEELKAKMVKAAKTRTELRPDISAEKEAQRIKEVEERWAKLRAKRIEK